jgi:hypothetical protein
MEQVGAGESMGIAENAGEDVEQFAEELDRRDENTGAPDLETIQGGRDQQNLDQGNGWTRVTRSGRVSAVPLRYREMANVTLDQFTNRFEALIDEEDDDDDEVALVGAGLGGGFEHTSELRTMKYKDAMKSPDKKKWDDAVEVEYHKIMSKEVFEPVPIENVPKDAKVLTSTWAMKKKANGVYRARITARGYEQVKGVHYHENEKAAPVVLDATVNVVLILMIIAKWMGEVMDVVGAFMNGEFNPRLPPIYMYVPEGFERFFPGRVLLLLKKTLYGLVQSAYMFWLKLGEAFERMGYKRCEADPCLHFRWTEKGLSLWVSYVDDNLTVGDAEVVEAAKKLMSEQFECEDVGSLKEYLGCKVDFDPIGRTVRLTQPVLLQSFRDEWDLPAGPVPRTPAVPNSILTREEDDVLLDEQRASRYRTMVGRALYLLKSRPEMRNAVRELTKFSREPTMKAEKALIHMMMYCVGTPDRGLLLKPFGVWNGMDRSYEFVISGRSDSEYAKDPDTRRSVMGYVTFVNGAPVTTRCKMENIVALSVTEAELIAAVECAQEMVSHKRLFEQLGLRVKLPMILEVDNQGAIDLINNWNCGGRTRHIDVRLYFLRHMKDIIEVKWISSDENTADLFTKNLMGPAFDRHTAVLCGHDKYMDDTIKSEGESDGSDRRNCSGSDSDQMCQREERVLASLRGLTKGPKCACVES